MEFYIHLCPDWSRWTDYFLPDERERENDEGSVATVVTIENGCHGPPLRRPVRRDPRLRPPPGALALTVPIAFAQGRDRPAPRPHREARGPRLSDLIEASHQPLRSCGRKIALVLAGPKPSCVAGRDKRKEFRPQALRMTSRGRGSDATRTRCAGAGFRQE